MAWVSAGEICRLHREKFPGSKMSRKNIEHAFIELYGFPKVMPSCVPEALGELERRENVVIQTFYQLDEKQRLPIDMGKQLFMSIRGDLFSDNWWEMFLVRRPVPLEPLKWDEIEVEICTRLFAISLDKVGAPADYMAKSERASFINEKRPSRLSRFGVSSRSTTRSRSRDSLMASIEEDPNDNDMTKKLKGEMQRTNEDNSRLPILQEVSEEAEKSDEVNEELLNQAKRLIGVLKEKRGLKNAISKKEIAQLEKTLKRIESKGLKDKLKKEYDEGTRLLKRLQTYERMRHEILALKQPTISEIRSYNTPPAAVRQVMVATYLLLGEPESELEDWRAVQALVGKIGKNTLKQRIGKFDPDSVDEATAFKAKAQIEQLNLDEIRDVSAGAATFFVWCTTMIQSLSSKDDP